MSLLRIVTGIWKSHDETDEQAKDPALRTRYYKANSDQLREQVLEVIQTQLPQWKVVHVDAERGEIMVEKDELFGRNDITISIYKLSPSSSAIDVVSAKNGPLGDFGSCYRNILKFYACLHQQVKPDR